MMTNYVKAIQKRSKNFVNRFQEAFNILFATRKGKLDKYVSDSPSHQTALDLFKEEWISRLPGHFQSLEAGEANLFEDPRIEWALNKAGDLRGKHILELGPLEGGHSYMLQKGGAASIVSIEANPRAYLRCLVIKQIMKLDQVDFLCGDFMDYMRQHATTFDLCIASGVLYHMCNPVELIALCASRASQLFLWTHYYDAATCQSNLLLRPRFSTSASADYQGFKHHLYRYNYKSARSWSTFCGGPSPFSNWLTRQDILDCCRYFGFKNIQINYEQVDHPHGPSFALFASK